MNNKISHKPNANIALAKTHAQVHYSGPIPSPHDMAGYGDIDVSFPNRIMTMAEQQAEHRRKMEIQTISESNVRAKMAIRYGAFLVVITECIGLYCALNDKDIAALSAIIGPIVSLCLAFIYGTRSNKNERLQKWEKIDPQKATQDES